MSSQLGHIWRDVGFVIDILLLGRWLDWIDDELGINHLRVGNKKPLVLV